MIINDILKQHYLFISVIGSHAGEELNEIFIRKQKDIETTGKTYWLIQSHKARTQQVQEMCEMAATKNIPVYCLFMEPSHKGGAKPTLHDKLVTSISSNNQDWENICNIIKITGKIGKNSTALVLEELQVLNTPKTFDLWEYSEFKTKNPIRMMLGASTVCCERTPSLGMKTRYRNIVGVGKLAVPYGLWLK